MLGVLSLGVFVLPYVFPPTSALLSASALAGFNNTLAYGWYVLALVLAAWVLSSQVSSEPVRQALEPTGPLFTAPPAIVVTVMVAHLALFLALYVVAHGFIFGEPLYFQDAAYRVMAGAVPFIDFNFFYGPLLISPVVFLARVTGLPAAYAIYYVASYLAGLYLLYVVLAAWLGRGTHLALWYVLFALGFFNPITGLNYTLGRFLIAIVTLMASWRVYHAVTAGRWLTAVGLMTLALLWAPDSAVVTLGSVGVLGLGLLVVEGPGRFFAWRGVALTGIAVCALVLASGSMLLIDGTWAPVVAYLRPLVTFSSGGWSTPIDPSLPMLALVVATMLTVARLWRGWRDNPGSAVTAMFAAYAVLLVLMQRASFGKADVVHIAFSGLPAFLPAATWTSSSAAGGRGLRWIAVMIVAGVVLPLQFYHAILFMPAVANRFPKQAPAVTASPAAPKPATKAEIQASIAKAVERFGAGRLYYMHRLEYYRLPVYLRYQLKPFLYHPSLTSAFTSSDIEGVIASLKQSDVVVLARRSDLVESPPQLLPRRWWYYATSSPLPGSEVYNLTLEFQYRLEGPLVTFLNSAYYVKAFEDGEIVGLVHAIQ